MKCMYLQRLQQLWQVCGTQNSIKTTIKQHKEQGGIYICVCWR